MESITDKVQSLLPNLFWIESITFGKVCAVAFRFKLPEGHPINTYTTRLRRAGFYVGTVKTINRTMTGIAVPQEYYSNFADGEKERRKARKLNAKSKLL